MYCFNTHRQVPAALPATAAILIIFLQSIWWRHGARRQFSRENLFFEFENRSRPKKPARRQNLICIQFFFIANVLRSYPVECTASHPNREVKQLWANLVLWLGTTRESFVL